MWKVIQGGEKAGFIKEYQDGQYYDDNIVVVDLTGNCPDASRTGGLSVREFVMDKIIVLVKVD